MIVREKVEKVIGKGFADKLDEAMFNVNQKFQYSRREMVEILGCANFIAAVRLAKVLRRLSINSPAQLYALDPISLARTRGIGMSALFVAMCILDAHKYDPIKWWNPRDKDNVVKFSTFKHHKMRQAKKHAQEVA